MADQQNVLVVNNSTTKVEESNDSIIITIVKPKTTAGLHPSSTGKTLVVGTTNGFVTTPSGISVSVNATVKNPNYVK